MEESKLLSLGGLINGIVGFSAVSTSQKGFSWIWSKLIDVETWSKLTDDLLLKTLAKNLQEVDGLFQTLGGAILIASSLLLFLEAFLTKMGVKGWTLTGATSVNVLAAGVILSRLTKEPRVYSWILVLAIVTALVILSIRIFALLKFFMKKPAKLAAGG